jgi:hypothetical protein
MKTHNPHKDTYFLKIKDIFHAKKLEKLRKQREARQFLVIKWELEQLLKDLGK